MARFISYISTLFFFFTIFLIVLTSIIDIIVTVITLGNCYLSLALLAKKFCDAIADGLFEMECLFL